jgi:hypothetical protein
MSIATDEATEYARHRYFGRVHIERRDGNAEIMPNDPRQINFRREGYIAGRTAESTEAEVRAAAIQQYFVENPYVSTLEQAEYDFDATISSNECRTRMMNARSVLATVRSAVMA